MEFTEIAPPVLATLNVVAAVLIVAGYRFIRNRRRRAHRYLMSSALVVSTGFMVIYLYYHALIGNIPFAGVGIVRPIYFLLLFSHVLLAAALLPMALLTAGFALTGRLERHRRIAVWTFPIWLYVSATGVVVYLMAFHLFTP